MSILSHLAKLGFDADAVYIPRNQVDEESIDALEAEKRLLDEILELTKKGDFTKADQGRLDALSAKRDKLHATEAWKKALAERKVVKKLPPKRG